MKTILESVELLYRAKTKLERAKRNQNVHDDIEIIDSLVLLVEQLQEAIRNTATASLSAPVLPADGALDPTNHHNALKCPYCNPQGLSFSSTPSEVVDLFRQAAKLTPREQWYLAETIANCIGQTLVDDPEPDMVASSPRTPRAFHPSPRSGLRK